MASMRRCACSPSLIPSRSGLGSEWRICRYVYATADDPPGKSIGVWSISRSEATKDCPPPRRIACRVPLLSARSTPSQQARPLKVARPKLSEGLVSRTQSGEKCLFYPVGRSARGVIVSSLTVGFPRCYDILTLSRRIWTMQELKLLLL